jgi:predicted DNA-binding transcriptional regulator AlpA
MVDKVKPIQYNSTGMGQRFSTRQAAKKLGIGHTTLAHYLEVGKIPAPESVILGERPTHLWTEEDIERARELLPKIANGRKTRYQKLREKQKPQPGTAVPQKSRTKKKK